VYQHGNCTSGMECLYILGLNSELVVDIEEEGASW
jgi:hypothetical protein